MDLYTAVSNVAARFEKEKIPIILIGGVAINMYGHSRGTEDIDFLISDDSVEKIKKVLDDMGMKLWVKNDLFRRYTKKDWNIKAIDFLNVEQATFEQIQKQSKKIKIKGHELLIPSIFHLIALKLHAIKNNKQRELGDLPDILEIMKINRVNPATDEFKNLCLKFGTVEIYTKILDGLGHE